MSGRRVLLRHGPPHCCPPTQTMDIRPRPLVSVVTPMYNEETYLGECIESVLAQTYQHWEYVILDNCSTDDSLSIARRYAAMDSRIRVVTNKHHLPAVANHNAALRHISEDSEYCKIVFGDDWLFPECLHRMVALAEAHPSVGIVSAYALEGQTFTRTGLPYWISVVPGRDIGRQQLIGGLHVFGTATNLLYRCGLIRNREAFYNETNIHADTEICFDVLRHCDFGFVHQLLTFTRVRPTSLGAVSVRRQSWLANILYSLGRYGSYYLSETELHAYIAQHLDIYYRTLARSVILGRDRELVAWHKKQLSESCVGYSRSRLIRGAVMEVLDALCNPKQTIAKCVKHKAERSSTKCIL